MGALTVELRAAPLVSLATADAGGPAAPVTLPRRRSPAVRVLQISAAAAAVVLAAGLGSLAGSLSSGGSPTATTVARTAGGNLGARLDRGVVAMAPAQKLPASRIRPTVAI
jgi:hypothetical protein